MWCLQCEQDVPGIAVQSDAARICCARCLAPLDTHELLAAENADVDSAPNDPRTISALLPVIDDWEIENELQTAGRLVQSIKPPSATRDNSLQPRTVAAIADDAGSEQTGLLARFLFWSGVIGLASGGALFAYVLFRGQTRFSPVAVAIAAAGHALITASAFCRIYALRRGKAVTPAPDGAKHRTAASLHLQSADHSHRTLAEMFEHGAS